MSKYPRHFYDMQGFKLVFKQFLWLHHASHGGVRIWHKHDMTVILIVVGGALNSGNRRQARYTAMM